MKYRIIKILVLGFILWSFLPFVQGHQNDLQKKSRERAESLAYQLLQIHADHLKNTNSAGRGPASVGSSDTVGESADWTQWNNEGQMGNDPWGDAYAFKMVKSESGKLEYIQVWSKHSPDKVVLKVK